MIFNGPRLLLMLLLLCPACLNAQTPATLVDTLSAISTKQLTAWQHHDKSAYLAVRDPGFMYVGPIGIIEPGHPVDNLLRCDVASVELSKARAVSVDENTAILIAEQHQTATCFGMKQPAVVNITETYVRRGGAWKLLLHTDAPALSLPSPEH